MKREHRKNIYMAIGLLSVFLLWTLTVRFVDVQPIGPRESAVGLATINRFVHDFTDVHPALYILTDWLGLVPLAFVVGFGTLGLTQWIKRKQLLKVDYSLLVLGGFYIVVLAVYVLFETVIVNYRPVLIDGCPEPSYPSSTTMLVLCVMPTAIMQLNARIKTDGFKRCVSAAIIAFMAFMVLARVVSGVHWFTDIIGGVLLSAGLVLLYHAVVCLKVR